MRYYTYMTNNDRRARRAAPRRLTFRRCLTAALLLPPAAALSAATTAAITAGAHDALNRPAAATAAPAPRPGNINFDTTDVDTAGATLRAAAYSPSAFDTIHSAMRKCKTEDGSGGPLPCASNAQAGIKYIVFSAGRRNRKTHIKPVIALYRDGHAERYTI